MNDSDFVGSLGLAFLAHRLRRASDSILQGTGPYLQTIGVDAPARSASTLLLLKREGPVAVMEIARRLRLTHPLIIKLLRSLADMGYVSEQVDPSDQRRRLISLTEAGRQQTLVIEAGLVDIEASFGELFEEMGVDLLAALQRFERAMDRRPMAARLPVSRPE